MPSRLVHTTGTQTLKLTVDYEAALDSTNGFAGPGTHNTSLVLRNTAVLGLQFNGLTSTNLPRGSTIKRANLHVVPNGALSMQGTVAADVRVSPWCTGDPDPLTLAQLAAANASADLVAWDINY